MDPEAGQPEPAETTTTKPATHYIRNIILFLIICYITWMCLMFEITREDSIIVKTKVWVKSHLRRHQSHDEIAYAQTVDDDCTCDHDDEPKIYPLFPTPAVRTQFGPLGTLVYGWPSTGGVWIHEDCYGVELDFLNVSRFEPAATEHVSDPVAEDELCQRLEWIGGRFYASERAYIDQVLEEHVERGSDTWFQAATWWYGWPGVVPEGGVWALQVRADKRWEVGISRIRNAFTMEERCRAIEISGGKFYEKWEDIARNESHDEL
ncbi:hypothetical protein LTR86_007257 [Recurvomyces mirabilis]|nr:hypothetical protein LTR86_007257 [Recurvomyces mirabilis]